VDAYVLEAVFGDFRWFEESLVVWVHVSGYDTSCGGFEEL